MRFKFFVVALFVLSLNVQAQQPRASRRAERRSITNAAAIVANAPPARVQDMRDTSQRGSVAGQSLPIRRVILYSNGVAYIERRGMVSGHAEVNLSFKQSQVDDVLKSMIVLDLGQGRIGAVSYNSSAPPSARIADIPFSVASATQSSGLAGVLGQLQGARVVVTTANRTATGSILTVEERRSQIDADKPALVTHALVIASESGELSSFELAEVRSVKLVDEGTRRDIAEFASATAAARRRDAKTIVVTSDGEGQREMLVSYTVAAPIWKTTYRVVLDAAGKPFFQGWAIVDNVSEEDWNAVQLSLISGTPVSFIQPIQQPFYRYRPVIPMPGNLSLNPQVYEPDEHTDIGSANGMAGGAPMPVVAADSDAPPPPPSPRSKLQASMRARGARTEAEVKQDLLLRQQNQVNNLGLLAEGTALATGQGSLSAAITGDGSGIAAAAEGNEVGDLFEYQIAQPVTVKRDRSALIPILQTRMEGARVSIFNEAIRRERPMSGMLLKNTSTLTLEDGAMTIIDGNAYAGEALMERLKPAEQRLISFALDLGTLVNVRMKEDRAPAYLVRILNGVFQAHYHRQDKKTYSLANQTDHQRIVYIEHPVRPGWELDDKETPKPEGRSARYYRFRVELKPHERAELTVTERQPLVDTFALTNVTPDQLSLFVSRKYIDDATRDALQKIVEIKSRIAAIDARLAAIDTEIAEIGEDQTRLRENIETLAQTPEAKQLIARYVAKADQQETRIEQLTKERQTANEERGRLQPQLDAAIRALSFDRNLTELTKQGMKDVG